MAYVRKIRTSQSEGPAVDVRKIKILNDGAVVDIKKSLYCDSNLNLIEIYNINPYYTIYFKYIKDNEHTPTTISTLILEEGKTIPTVPTAPNMVGWVFSHWVLDEESYTETQVKAIQVNSDLTFIAYYIHQTFTVRYYNNQESLVQGAVTYNNRPITDITTLGVTLTPSPEIGYTKEFIGWSLSNNNIPFDFTNYQAKSDLALYACFSKTPINYTIIFNYDTPYDGRIEITRVSNVKIGDNIYNSKPPRPVRYLLGDTSSWHYSNDFSYYRGITKTPLTNFKTLTTSIISTYAVGTEITLSLNYFEQAYSQPVLSSFSSITPDYYHGNPLVYFKNKFIAGGDGRVYYNDSPKTKAWTSVELPNNEVAIMGFAYTSNILVGFTNVTPYLSPEYPQLVYSLDGINWHSPYEIIGTNHGVSCIASYNNGFILSTLDGRIYTSTNGTDWMFKSIVGAGFTFGVSEGPTVADEHIRAITVTKNNIVIVATNQNTSYCAEISTWTWRKIANIPSDVPSLSTFLMSITAEGDVTLGRVLWLKNYGRVFELRPTETIPYVNWVEVSNISNSTALQKGFIYRNNRYFAVGEYGSYAHTADILENWNRDLQGSNYNFSSIAANSNYVVALADDANNSNVKRVFTVDWRASYSLPIHTLTFDTQGGNSIEPIINVNKIPQSPPIPTKAGHTFLGWQFYDENYGYWGATAGEEIYEDKTLYAKWKLNT